MNRLSDSLQARLLLSLVILCSFCFAQDSGKLSGKVSNMTGQGVPQAEIRLKNTAGTVQTTTSGSDGFFTFDRVTPGSYTVELQAGGRTQNSSKTLEIASTGSTALELIFDDDTTSPVGRTGELEIRASSSTVQSDSAEVSRAYETRLVRSLPLLDRQNQDLIGLMPGVTPPVVVEDRILDPQRSRIYNVNGLPDYANVYRQDGSYQNENFSGRQSRIVPNSAIQQLEVRTSNYNAEHGMGGGAAINTVTRPGTNGVHGSAFGLHTNRFLTTRSPVNFSTNNPGFNVNQFGGSVGGPIVKDKTFFFLGYEAYLRRGAALQFFNVPSAAARTGDFSAVSGLTVFNPQSGNALGANRVPFPGNRIPTTLLNPASVSILSALPAANQPGAVNNFVGSGLLREDQHRADGKIDHRFSEKSTGFFRYGFTHGSVDRGSSLGVLGDGAQSGLRNHNAVASLTQSFTTTLAAEFRVGYSRYRNEISPLSATGDLDNELTRLGLSGGVPQINISGFGTFGYPSTYSPRSVNNTYDAATNWNWHNGMHHLKIGAQAVHIRADGFNTGEFSSNGTFSFGPGPTSSGSVSSFDLANNSLAAFLTGSPTVSGVSNFLQTPTNRQTLTSFYATDTINLWKNVHLELGMRYDVFSPLRTRTSTGNAIFNAATNSTSLNNGEGDYDFNNIAPRIGIVVRPIERIAIRAGYGLQYFPVPFAYSGLNQATSGVQLGLGGSLNSVAFRVPTQTTATPTADVNQTYSLASSDAQTPYVQTYSFMIQSDLGNGFLMDIGYLGNLGRQLPYRLALNVANPGSGVAGLPFSGINRTAGVNAWGTGLNSNYNSLQVNLTKRVAAGLSLAGAYTWGKALDTGFNQSNNFNTQNNYGVADWDRKHVLAISHLWQLPFGPGSAYFTQGKAAQILGSWQLNGIIRWATGTPYSITGDPLLCNCPGVQSVRAVTPGGFSVDGQSTFDISNITIAQGGFSPVGRNTFRGPDYFTYDASLFRSFPFRENYSFELRAEVYNVTNTTNLANPISSLSSLGAGTSTRTFNGAFGRQFQVGARILF